MKKSKILTGLKAVKNICSEVQDCKNCGLSGYCEYRKVLGAPHLYPHFCLKTLAFAGSSCDDKVVYISLDDLFNGLNEICCRSLYCGDCVIKDTCEKTCGFTIIPEFWKL